MDVVLVAVVALAGIAATFFAPSYTRRTLEERRETRALRAAARLVAHDLNVIAAQLTAGHADELPLAAWDEHRHVLAAALPLEDWRAVANVFGRAAALRASMNGRGSLDEKAKALLSDAAKRAQAARDVLAAAGQ